LPPPASAQSACSAQRDSSERDASIDGDVPGFSSLCGLWAFAVFLEFVSAESRLLWASAALGGQNLNRFTVQPLSTGCRGAVSRIRCRLNVASCLMRQAVEWNRLARHAGAFHIEIENRRSGGLKEFQSKTM